MAAKQEPDKSPKDQTEYAKPKLSKHPKLTDLTASTSPPTPGGGIE